MSTSSKPGGSTYATGGFGSSSHLAVALFSFISGAKFNHVSYKGAGPALTDVVAGHIDFTVATLPGAIQQVRSSGLRALGISSLTRSPELPDVPTVAETGLPGYEYVAWFGVFAPGTTRPELVARIGALLREAIDSADTRDRLRIQGVEPQIQEPDQFREKVRSEIERWIIACPRRGAASFEAHIRSVGCALWMGHAGSFERGRSVPEGVARQRRIDHNRG